MKEETYQQVKVQTDELIEHIKNEGAEIGNVRAKLTAQTLENIGTVGPLEVAPPKEDEEVQSEDVPSQPAEAVSVVQASAESSEEKDATTPASSAERTETSWLNQVITK